MESAPKDLAAALLDSWDRQCRILMAVAGLVDAETRGVRPSPDGMALDLQLAHVNNTRKYWLSEVDPARSATLGRVYKEGSPEGVREAIDDLDEIRRQLDLSAAAIRATMAGLFAGDGAPVKGKYAEYAHPVLFLQHMVWHEGWHVGLLMLGLRLAGHEPEETWEEAHVWGEWRKEEWEPEPETSESPEGTADA